MRCAVAAAIAVAALALAGCGGSKQSSGQPAATTPAPARPLTELDLVNIIGPAPVTPANADYTPGPTSTLTLADLRQRARTAAARATITTFEKAGFRMIYQRSFDGAVNSADGTAYLFGSTAGGARAFTVLERTLSKPSAAGQQVTPFAVSGLGDAAWGAHVTGASEAAVFLWRRRSLVVVADMVCQQGCGLDIVAAARAYAQAIDERAAQTP